MINCLVSETPEHWENVSNFSNSSPSNNPVYHFAQLTVQIQIFSLLTNTISKTTNLNS